MRFMPGEIAVPGDRPVVGLGAWPTSSSRTSAWSRPAPRPSVKINAYPDKSFERQDHLRLSRRSRPRRAPCRCASSWPTPASCSSRRCSRRSNCRWAPRRPVLTVPDSAVIDSGTRRIVLVQLQGGPLRAARGQARRAQRQLRGGARGRQGRRAGGGRRQLPDRRGEQPEGRHRRAGQRRATASPPAPRPAVRAAAAHRSAPPAPSATRARAPWTASTPRPAPSA